ncbi:TPM domain-containing protein [Aurantiacibacter sp. D1-12]|uniref:TPM domain-containing protein n=1 Tax=Aurantiacibacter sp. D1-12 TaxID=2993658 RepID=UPI00237CB399|nr:TPM domain-containing protein [Aurantiacibacter sp. D1-12]MDE1466210.1 TPM domain-containing protein [Aurantiacibacter sp. D1-12]
MIATRSPQWPLRLLLVLFAALMAANWAAVAHAQPVFPDRGTSPVLDQANIIDANTEAKLTQQLDAFEERNQRQFVIVTLDSLQGYDIADYGYQLGREWALGDAENNDGIILIVAPNERRMRIEVGYGLEHIIPDGLAFEYVEGMKDYFRAGDFSGGIAWASDQIITQLELPPEEAAAIAQQAGQSRSEGGFPIGTIIWLGFLFFFFILPMISGSKGRRRYRGGVAGTVGDIILWEAGKAIVRGASGSGGGGWSGGGGFGGGGGFSGGGGSFGGGGASGGW